MMNDITNRNEVSNLVDAFYKEALKDGLLGPIFHAAVHQEEWPSHLERINDFWNTVLFGEGTYRGNPFSKHSHLPLEKRHFERWVELFCGEVDKLFSGTKADEVKFRAKKMGELFEIKMQHIKSNPGQQSIL